MAVQQQFAIFVASPSADINALFAQTRALYFDNAANNNNNADKSQPFLTDLLAAYTQAVSTFVSKPVLTPEDVVQQVQLSQELSLISTKSGRMSGTEARKIQLISALNSGTERLKMEVKEKYRKMG